MVTDTVQSNAYSASFKEKKRKVLQLQALTIKARTRGTPDIESESHGT